MMKTDRRRSLVAVLGLGVAIVAVIILLVAALGHRTGMLSLGPAFTLLRWGAYAGIAGLVVSIVGLVMTITRRASVHGIAVAALGVALGTMAWMLPARQQSLAREVPPIHDISTDTETPPEFVAIAPLRANAPNPVTYDPSIAPQQHEAYPDLTPIELEAPPAEAFELALEAAHAMGWDLVDADPSAGRIEATATTFWFGFKDDVVVRVQPAAPGSRVDVRSKSRVGRSDVGANARRIRAYRDELTGN